MDYNIIMTFITWVIVILMVFGFIFIKSCEYDLKNKDSKSSDHIRMGEDNLIQMYNERKFAGRVLLVLWCGAILICSLFEITKRDD